MRYLYQNKHWKINKEYNNIDKLLYLIIDRPNKITSYHGGFIWINNKNQSHRDYDLPSCIVFNNNNKTCILLWNNDNKTHREKSKPAYIYDNGYKQYYLNGKLIKTEQTI